MKTLTIGIPTYKRKEIIVNVIKKLIPFIDDNSDFEIIVSDNASNDGTVEKLENITQNIRGINIFENSENLGFGGNLSRLFQEAKGKYLLIISDEDKIVKENVNHLINFLKENQPTFVSTQFIRNVGYGDFIYMGRKNNKRIKLSEFHASSFYISGLVYSVEESKNIINDILNKKDLFVSAFIYPHTLLSAHLLLKYDNSFWYKYPLTKQKHNLEPQSTMKDDSKYNSIANRWKQYFGFIDYFEDYKKNGLSNKEVRLLNKLLENHKKKLFYWLRWGVSTNNKDYIDYFDIGAIDFFFDTFKFKLTQILNKVFRHKLYLKEKHTTIPTKATWRLTRKK